MSLEHLRRLVADAERQPRLRALLRQGASSEHERPWQRLIERARALGYADRVGRPGAGQCR